MLNSSESILLIKRFHLPSKEQFYPDEIEQGENVTFWIEYQN
jgi:hypothetical protein